MNSSILLNRPDIINYQKIKSSNILVKVPYNIINSNPVLEVLNTENSEDFANYIEWLGLGKDPNLVILSSKHHYYYDAEELKEVKTIINLKELNRIKNIKGFLHSIFHLITPNTYFISYFIDNHAANELTSEYKLSSAKKRRLINDIKNGIVSKNTFLNKMFRILDLKTYKYMSKESVKELLKGNGFKVLDMTELNGMTYFCVQKSRIVPN